jgi:ribonucleoside-diphosphate reductase alpha chain
VSFMKGFDAFAGVIKSGGKTRRAAKMVILNVEHPDIVEFIECKYKEEQKAHALIREGYDSAIDGEAYTSIFFQNANHSVRVSDDFMRAVEQDKDWWTKNVIDGQPSEKLRARDLLYKMAESTWHCGDPGMQYDTTVNRWHTCKNTARINASNPCSEYMFLDDTACNLASLNLMKYVNSSGSFDVEAFKHAVDVTITAQEVLVDFASYPTPKIAENSHNFRPLGLGYANLGARCGGSCYGDDVWRSVRAIGTRGGAHGAVPWLRGEPRTDAGRDSHAPGVGAWHPVPERAAATDDGSATVVGRCVVTRRTARL